MAAATSALIFTRTRPAEQHPDTAVYGRDQPDHVREQGLAAYLLEVGFARIPR
jgi:hypothetical protein